MELQEVPQDENAPGAPMLLLQKASMASPAAISMRSMRGGS